MIEEAYGWEVSDLDVEVALDNLGLPVTEETTNEVLSFINRYEVENAALQADEMEEQFELSIKNIEAQIKAHRGEE